MCREPQAHKIILEDSDACQSLHMLFGVAFLVNLGSKEIGQYDVDSLDPKELEETN